MGFAVLTVVKSSMVNVQYYDSWPLFLSHYVQGTLIKEIMKIFWTSICSMRYINLFPPVSHHIRVILLLFLQEMEEFLDNASLW